MPAPGIEIEEGCRSTIGGVDLVYSRLRAVAGTRARLALDARFVRDGIVRGGALLDQAATEAQWQGPVGRRPESWLQEEPAGTIAFCPTNWGWHAGCWFLERDDEGARWLGLPGDLPRGDLWVLGRMEDGWQGLAGSPEDLLASGLGCGLEMPCLVTEGQARPLHFVLGHARLRADLRNVFDFAAGRGPGLPPEFWVLLRKILPTEVLAARIFLEGGAIELPLDAMEPGEADRLARLVRATQLPALRMVGGALRVEGPLPKARIPAFGLGATPGGDLVVVAVQGRGRSLPGVTIEELAQLLVESGVASGGFGSAGGDVALVERTAAGTCLRNLPSNRDRRTGQPVSRRVPAVLLLEP